MIREKNNHPLKFLRHPAVIVLSFVAGILFGLYAGDLAARLQPVGSIYLFLLQMTVIPVLTFALITSVARLVHSPGTLRLGGKALVVFIGFFLLTAFFGLLIGLLGKPGENLAAENQQILGKTIANSPLAPDLSVSLFQPKESIERLSLIDLLTGIVPSNIFFSLARGIAVQIVLFSIVFGIALGLLKERQQDFLITITEGALRVFKGINRWLIYLFPIGGVCLVGSIVAAAGVGMLLAMLKFVLVLFLAVLIGMGINLIIVWRRSGQRLSNVISAIVVPSLYGLITGSSLVALPYSLEALGRKLGYPEDRANMVVPFGTVLGRFGNALYFVLATIFVAQFYQVGFGPAEYFLILGSSIVAAVATSGRFGAASAAMLAFVFSPLGLPLEAVFVVFLAIDFIVAPLLALFDVQANLSAFTLISRKTQAVQEKRVARLAFPGFRFSIRTSIVALLASLIVLTGIVMIGLLYSGGKRSAYYLADNMINEISGRVRQRTLAYFLPAERSNRRLSYLIQEGFVDLQDRAKLLSLMRQELKDNPEFAAVYFGDVDGNFTMVKRMPDSSLSDRIIDRTDRQVIIRWRHENPLYREAFPDEDTSLEKGYDPRKRGWYQEAVSAGDLIWTDVYLFASDKMPGLSSSIPVRNSAGDLAGVLSVDIGIAEISYFLGSLDISEIGKIFIMNSKNELLALSATEGTDLESLITVTDSGEAGAKYEPVLVDSTPDELISTSYLAYQRAETKSEFLTFRFNRNSFLAKYDPFPPERYFEWTIGIILPEEEVMGYVNRTYGVVLFAAVVLILSAVGVGINFSKAISVPLKTLSREMEKIRNFDLSHDEAIASKISEVVNMADSFDRMKKGLRAFNKYVPSQLVSQMIRMGTEPEIGGHKRRVTILFSDITDFTRISEKLSPEKLVDEMAVYFSHLSDIIMTNSGTVDKYVGDAIMAFWNAPIIVPEHAVAACRSALECQRVLKRLKERYATNEVSVFETQTRIGLHTGEVIVGNMGSSERLNYTAVGDNVNLASRMEGLNKFYGTDIIISEVTYRETDGKAVARLLDRVAVKGSTRGIQVYELAGIRDELDDETLEFVETASQAVEAYFEQRWEEAIAKIDAALRERPHDRALSTIKGRSEQFLENPPGSDWNGIYEYHEK